MQIGKDFAALLSLTIFLAALGTAVGKFPWSFDDRYGHGICQGSGDVHHTTFDNWRSIDFQGPCLYTLTRLCCGSCTKEDKFCPLTDFHVKIKQRPVGTPTHPLAYVDYIVVEICGYSVILDEGQWAVVETTHANYGPITPFTTYSSGVSSLPQVWDCEGGTQFKLSPWGSNGIQFETKFMIIYNMPAFVKVKLSKKYKSKVCGICGNFNGIANDDMVTRDGVDARVYPDGFIWSVADTYVGNSWKVYNPGQPNCVELNPWKIPYTRKGKREVSPDPGALCRKYLGQNKAMRKNCDAKVVGYALRECYEDASASNQVSQAAIKEAICAAMVQMMANCPISEKRNGGNLEVLSKEYGCYQEKE